MPTMSSGTIHPFIPLSLSGAMVSFLGISALSAQDLYEWNPSGTGIPSGGTGVWDSSSALWSWNKGKTYEAWPAPGEYGYHSGIATFGGTSGTVTTSGALTTGGLYFTTGGYVINAGSGSTLELVRKANGSNPTITVAGSGNNATINAPLSGTEGLDIKGGGTLTLTGENTFTGGIVISGGNLKLMAATGSIHSSNDLRFSSYTIGEEGGGSFTLDNTGATAARSQSFSGLQVESGDITITSRRAAEQNLTLTFNNFSTGNQGSRVTGSTINFISDGGTNGTQNRIILNGISNGFVGRGVFFNGADFAWRNSGGYLRAINYGTDSGTVSYAGGTSLSSTSHALIRGAITQQSSATFLSMKIDGAHNITLGSGSTLTTGALLKTGDSASTITGGVLRSSSGNDLVVRVNSASDSLTINSTIADNGGTALTKSGEGTLFLNGTNTFAGYENYDGTFTSLYLNGGTVSVSSLPTGNAAGTIGTGGIQFSGGTLRYTGTNSITTNRKIDVRANGGSIDVANSNTTLTLEGTIIGAGSSLRESSLVKTGAGTLVLSGTEDNSGLTLSVDAGTVVLAKDIVGWGTAVGTLTANSGSTVRLAGSNGNQINDYATISINTGAVLDLNGRNETIGYLQGGGTVTNQSSTANSILSIGYGDHDSEFSGVISNGSSGRTVSIEKFNPGTQILSGNNTYTGTTTIHEGTLQIGNGGTTGAIAGNVVVEYMEYSYDGYTYIYDGILAFNRSDSYNYTGNISGSGRVIQKGPGTLSLSGGNSYTGSTTISGGILSASTLANGNSNSSIGASNSNATSLILDGGTLRYTGSGANTNRLFTLTENGGALDASGTGTISFTRNASISMSGSGSRALTLTGTGVGSFASVIGNPTGSTTSLIKSGTGTWTLSGTNTFTGGVSVNGGTLTVSSNNNLGETSGTITLGGGNLNLASSNAATFNRAVTVSSNSTITSNRSSNGAGLTHTLGTLSIGSQELLIVRGTAATSGTGGIIFGNTSFTGNATFSTGANTSLTLGALNDGGSARTITKSGSGSLVLGSAATSLTNGTVINLQAGNINLNHATALGSLSNVSVSSGATLAIGTSVNATLGALNGAGTVTIGSNTLTIGTTNNLNSSFGGSISGTSGRLVKNGTGTLNLTSANTYTGGTTISGGRVSANNTSGSAFGTGSVTVQFNTTLSGIGSFTGAARIEGTYAPGNSVGNLTSGSITIASTGAYEWEINNATGTAGNASGGWDLATVNGTLAFESGATLFIKSLGLDNLAGLAVNFDASQNYSWVIATTTGGITGLGNVTLNDTGFQNSHDGAFSVGTSGNNLLLHYNAIPEPTTPLLLLLGATTLFRRKRDN